MLIFNIKLHSVASTSKSRNMVQVPEDEGKAANQYPIWGTTKFHTNWGPSFLMYPVPFLTHNPAEMF